MSSDWYMGTANAIYQNMNLFQGDKRGKWVLILSGDHIYKMDYLKQLLFHNDVQADLSLSCMPVPTEEADRFGIVETDENSKSQKFY